MNHEGFGWLAVLIVFLILILGSPYSHAYGVSLQDNHPWTISECDKHGKKAKSVFNVSIWNSGGFPLWRVTCVW